MANLYGYLRSDRSGASTRASSRRITAEVQTWQDRLSLSLTAGGDFELWREAGPSGCGPRVLIASGSVSDLERTSSPLAEMVA